MRNHQQIIADAGGYGELSKHIDVPASTTRFWERRNSIPDGYWTDIVSKGLASIDELMGASAHRRKRARQTAS